MRRLGWYNCGVNELLKQLGILPGPPQPPETPEALFEADAARQIAENSPSDPRRRPLCDDYCPACLGSTWFYAQQGPASRGVKGTTRVKVCVACLANGKMTTY